MNYIGSTEFGCKNCSHTGHFNQSYSSYRVSDIATCPQCNTSFDVSRAQGIEGWSKRHSFTLINTHQNYTARLRIGGAVYEIPPNGEISVRCSGNDLFEYQYTEAEWTAYTSVWYFCYARDWQKEIDIRNMAYVAHTGNTKSSQKNSWW